jgi:hypothetical protein
MYVAKHNIWSYPGNGWTVEKEYPCINGLKCWFVICTIDEPSEAEVGYTDGAMQPAKERAEWIAKVLNQCGDEYG